MLFTDGGEERAQEIFAKYNKDKKVSDIFEYFNFYMEIVFRRVAGDGEEKLFFSKMLLAVTKSHCW